MSTKKSVVTMSLALSAMALAACSANQQSQSSAPTAASASASAQNGATLTVTPASVDGCKSSQPVVATVNWHSTDPHVKVMVAGPGQAPRLFSESGYEGSAKTGKWMVANMQFLLVDAASGKTLASRIVGATPCN